MRNDRSTYSKRRDEISDRLSTDKQSKEEVSYRGTTPEDVDKCIECEYYEKPGEDSSSCKKVAGLVYADDTCDLFEKRSKEDQGHHHENDTVQSLLKLNIELGIGE